MPTRRITKKDGSWVQVDTDRPDNEVTDGDHSIDVKYKDWSGTTHRHHIRKDEIDTDREWQGVPPAVIVVGLIVLLAMAKC